MSDYELLPESPLGGVEIELDGFNITEVTDKSLVMVALPREKFKDVESSIDKSCGLKLPEMECSTESKDSSITLWRLQKNQVLAYFTYEGNDAESHLSSRLSAPAYYTDQSDTWAMIRVSGNRSRESLREFVRLILVPRYFQLEAFLEHYGAYRNNNL